jgi:hypothetical protein
MHHAQWAWLEFRLHLRVMGWRQRSLIAVLALALVLPPVLRPAGPAPCYRAATWSARTYPALVPCQGHR